MAEDGKVLAALGLSELAEDTYRVLLSLPEADMATLACHLDQPGVAVSEAMPELLDHGLARMVGDDVYSANSPELSIAALLAKRMDRLRHSYAAIGEFERTYRSTRRQDGTVPGTETVRGLVAIRSRFEQLTVQAKDEVRMFMRRPLLTDDAGIGSAQPKHVSARYRALYEKALLDDSDAVELVRRSAERGFHVRFTASLPVKLAVADGTTALIMEPGAEPVALLTEHSALVTMAAGLFEQVWATAVPAPGMDDEALTRVPRSGGPSDPDDRLLLSLLLAGLTDQTIATRLGVGLRTVQRRVRDLMDAANVDTRIQLGWQASRKGWV